MVLDIKSIFTKNFINLSLNQGVNVFATLIYTPLLFQTLGDENYGLINLAFSLIIIVSIFVGYGYNLNGPIKVANAKNIHDKNLIVNNIISLRIAIAFIIIILSFPIIYFIIEPNFQKILLFSLIILLNEALNPLFLLQGLNKIFPQAVINFFSKSIYVVLLYLFLGVNDAYLANFFYGLSASIVVLFFWIRYYSTSKLSFKFYFTDIKNLLFENFTLFLSSASTHFTLNSALIILSFFTNDKELGRFTLAFKIAFLLRMVPVFFIQSALQNASNLNNKSDEKFKKYISKYFKIGLYSSLVIVIICSLFSDSIIYLFAGEKINYSSEILTILSFVPILAMLNFKNVVYILVNDLKTTLNTATFGTLIFMISSSIILCKLYGGYGLAYALLSTEIFSFSIHFYLINKR